jgi:hypothetical protein
MTISSPEPAFLGERPLVARRVSACKVLVALALVLPAGGCTMFAGGFVNDRAASTSISVPPSPATPPAASGPLLNPDGSCDGPVPQGATVIAPGIGECELVRLKAAPPTDVLIGQGGTGQREAQVLYNEPGGREIYLFRAGRLDRIVKPGQ